MKMLIDNKLGYGLKMVWKNSGDDVSYDEIGNVITDDHPGDELQFVVVPPDDGFWSVGCITHKSGVEADDNIL